MSDDSTRRYGQRSALVFGLLSFVWPQLLRRIGFHVAQLLRADVVELLALGELARFGFLAPGGKDFEQFLGLAKLQGEGIGLLLAPDELLLDFLILRVQRRGGKEKKRRQLPQMRALFSLR